LFPEPPQPLNAATPASTAMRTNPHTLPEARCHWRRLRVRIPRLSRKAAHKIIVLLLSLPCAGASLAAADVVEIVSDVVAAPVPLGVTVDGENVQLPPVGNPEQVN